jgi:hypothetical protein
VLQVQHANINCDDSRKVYVDCDFFRGSTESRPTKIYRSLNPKSIRQAGMPALQMIDFRLIPAQSS